MNWSCSSTRGDLGWGDARLMRAILWLKRLNFLAVVREPSIYAD